MRKIVSQSRAKRLTQRKLVQRNWRKDSCTRNVAQRICAENPALRKPHHDDAASSLWRPRALVLSLVGLGFGLKTCLRGSMLSGHPSCSFLSPEHDLSTQDPVYDPLPLVDLLSDELEHHLAMELGMLRLSPPC